MAQRAFSIFGSVFVWYLLSIGGAILISWQLEPTEWEAANPLTISRAAHLQQFYYSWAVLFPLLIACGIFWTIFWKVLFATLGFGLWKYLRHGKRRWLILVNGILALFVFLPVIFYPNGMIPYCGP